MGALHQIRLAHPKPATLVTGSMRDIALLRRANAQHGEMVTVLNVPLDVNRRALLALLDRGVQDEYFDHHGAREVPDQGD